MNKTSTALLVLAACAQITVANQITFTGSNGLGSHQSGQGGAFTVRPDQELSWVLGYYSPLARNVGGTSGTFQTFCVEKTEHTSPGVTYDVVLSSRTEMSGVDLTLGAAWLYYQFATGGLAGYNYATGSGAGALQETFWWLMGQTPAVNNTFSQTVVNALGAQQALTPNNGVYPVEVMNLWAVGRVENENYGAQDQMVLTGRVPDAASTFLLLSLTFSMALMVRKGQSGF